MTSSNDYYIYCADYKLGTVTEYNTNTGKLHVIKNVGNNPCQLILTGDSKTLFVGNWADNSITVIDTISRSIKDTLKITPNDSSKRLNRITLSIDEKALYVTYDDSTVMTTNIVIVDIATLTVTKTYDNPYGQTLNVVESADEKLYFAIRDENTGGLGCIPLNGGPMGATPSFGGPLDPRPPRNIAVSPDFKNVYVNTFYRYANNSGTESELYIFDTASFKLKTSIENVGGDRLVMSKSGDKYYTSQPENNTINVYKTDAASSTPEYTISVDISPRNMFISGDGNTMYACDSATGNIARINLTNNEVLPTIKLGAITAVAITGTHEKPRPKIFSFTPQKYVSYSTKTSITIVGENFSPNNDDNSVVFNSISGDQIKIPASTSTSTQLTVSVELIKYDFETGSFTVCTNGVSSEPSDIEFAFPPKIDSITPKNPQIGQNITIVGLNLDSTSPFKILFPSLGGIIEKTVTLDSDGKSLTTKVPTGVTNGQVGIFNNNYTVVNKQTTYFLLPDPIISSFSSKNIKPGELVTVYGKYFRSSEIPSQPRIYIVDKKYQTLISTGYSDENKINFVIPAGLKSYPSTFKIKIKITYTGSASTESEPSSELNLSLPEYPEIQYFSRYKVDVGQSLRITAYYLSQVSGSNYVKFNGISEAVKGKLINYLDIQVTVPKGAQTGTIKVQSQGKTSLPSKSELVIPVKTPIVSKLNPSKQYMYEEIYINGFYFSDIVEDNKVYFSGPNNTTIPAPVNTATGTQLSVDIPKNAINGNVYVEVTHNGQTKSSNSESITILPSRSGYKVEKITSPTTKTLNCAAYVPFRDGQSRNDTPLYIIGGNNTLLYSTDGTSWQKGNLKNLNTSNIISVAGTYKSTISKREPVLTILLDNNTTYLSIDNGKNWSKNGTIAQGININKLLIKGYNIYALGKKIFERRNVGYYKMSDAQTNPQDWNDGILETGLNGYSDALLEDQIYFVGLHKNKLSYLGKSGFTLRTIDTNDASRIFLSIAWNPNLNRIVVVGKNSSIFSCDNAIIFSPWEYRYQIPPHNNGYTLNNVIYSEALNAFVAVGNQKQILFSDTGKNWEKQPLLSSLGIPSGTEFNQVIDGDNCCIIVGTNGVILKMTNR